MKTKSPFRHHLNILNHAVTILASIPDLPEPFAEARECAHEGLTRLAAELARAPGESRDPDLRDRLLRAYAAAPLSPPHAQNAIKKHRDALLSLAETLPDHGLSGDAKVAVTAAARVLRAAENTMDRKRRPIGKVPVLVQIASEFTRRALAADPDSEAGEALSAAVGLLTEARELTEPAAPAGGEGFIQAWAGNLDFIAAELLGCKGEDLPHMLGQLPNRLKTLAEEMRGVAE